MGDEPLVTAALAGDAGAFGDLYRAHVEVVSHVVRSNVRDPDCAPDVVQEVFTRALDQLARLRERDRFRAWLLTIARNVAIDSRRSDARHPVLLSLSDPEASTVELRSNDAAVDEMAELREMARLVVGCLAGLSARDATALALVAHLGFVPAEVASVLGVTEGTARVIVHRARHRLREALALEATTRRRDHSAATHLRDQARSVAGSVGPLCARHPLCPWGQNREYRAETAQCSGSCHQPQGEATA